MAVMGGRVPMFKLRPYKSFLIAALMIGIIGGLLSAYFFIEDAGLSQSRSLGAAAFTGVMAFLCVIGAYSRYGFSHLHHRRPGYKRG
jgi:peptidoglycan/LPS O-acetylase OafA/YrhL